MKGTTWCVCVCVSSRMCRLKRSLGVMIKQVLSGGMWQKRCPWAIQPGQMVVKQMKESKVPGTDGRCIEGVSRVTEGGIYN